MNPVCHEIWASSPGLGSLSAGAPNFQGPAGWGRGQKGSGAGPEVGFASTVRAGVGGASPWALGRELGGASIKDSGELSPAWLGPWGMGLGVSGLTPGPRCAPCSPVYPRTGCSMGALRPLMGDECADCGFGIQRDMGCPQRLCDLKSHPPHTPSLSGCSWPSPCPDLLPLNGLGWPLRV